MKRHQLTYLLLTLLSVGLITACNKSKDVAPVSPIVGQFNIQRVEYTDVAPTTLGLQNEIDSTDLGTDTYVFSADQTFTNNYSYTNSSGSQTTGAAAGTWSYVTSLQILTLTDNPQNGQAISSAAYYFNPTKNEFSTGKIAQRQDSVRNPTTGAYQTVTYNINFVYRKTK